MIMIVFKWGGVSIWLDKVNAEMLLAHDPMRQKIAYIVRCKPRAHR